MREDKPIAVSTGQERTAWLDSVRGLAIVWIFLVHFVERLTPGSLFANPAQDWPPLAERIAQLRPLSIPGAAGLVANALRYVGWLGDQGVQILLVAGGFALTLASLGRGQRLEIRHYTLRRLGRILPTWWILHGLLMLSSVLLGWGLTPTDWRSLASLAGLRFLPDVFYFFAPAWWYVGLLLQLYVVFPLLRRFLLQLGPLRFFLLVGGSAVVVRALGLCVLRQNLDWWSRGGLFVTRLPEFALGMSLAFVYAKRKELFAALTRGPLATTAWVAAYVAGNVLSFTRIGMSAAFLLTGSAAFVLLYRLVGDERRARLGAAAWMGRHSYSIFLVHHPLTLLLVPAAIGLANTGRVAAFLGLAAGASLLAALCLEKVTERVVQAVRRIRQSGGVLRAALGIGGVLVACYAALVGAEAFVRAVAPQEAEGWGERESLVPDDELSFHLRPDSVTRLRWDSYDYVVSANRLGFPGPMHATAKPDGTWRVFVTGDAFESAEGVDTAAAWPRLLESELNSSVAEGSQVVQVQNFSITGWGPNQYAAVVGRYAPEYSPDLILVGLFVNDFFDVRNSDSEFHDSIGFGLPAQRSLWSIVRLTHLRVLLQHKVAGRVRELLTGKPYAYGYFLGNFKSLERAQAPVMRENALQVGECLLAIREVADSIGARVLVVLVPAPVQVCGPDKLNYYPRGLELTDGERFDLEQPQRLAREVAAGLGIHCLDLRPVLVPAAADGPYQPRNMHFTEKGHALVAGYVAEHLVRLGYVR